MWRKVRASVRRAIELLVARGLSSPEFQGAVGGAVAMELQAAAAEISRVTFSPSGDLPTVFAELLRSMDRDREDALRVQLATRFELTRAMWRLAPQPPATGRIAVLPNDFSQTLAALKSLHPHLWDRWAQINFVDNPAEFSSRPEGSCSIGKRGTDAPFGGFIAPYLTGDVLDVGCGPYATPSYLRDYPSDRIYGLDPLEPFEPHPFTFVRGFGEFVPFPDRSFDVVIAATSLDHSFSLDRTVSEIARVLKPGGRLLVWDGFVKGSPRYRPDDAAWQQADRFHLFHFDEPWFEALMGEHGLHVHERVAFDPSSHNPQYCTSFFYCVEKPA